MATGGTPIYGNLHLEYEREIGEMLDVLIQIRKRDELVIQPVELVEMMINIAKNSRAIGIQPYSTNKHALINGPY